MFSLYTVISKNQGTPVTHPLQASILSQCLAFFEIIPQQIETKKRQQQNIKNLMNCLLM